MHSNSCKFALDNYHNYHINVIKREIRNHLYLLKLALAMISDVNQNMRKYIFGIRKYLNPPALPGP